jgi:hypothetical protein
MRRGTVFGLITLAIRLVDGWLVTTHAHRDPCHRPVHVQLARACAAQSTVCGESDAPVMELPVRRVCRVIM